MYPVAGGTVRTPLRDVQLAGGKYVLPKGVMVFLPVAPALRTSCQHSCNKPVVVGSSAVSFCAASMQVCSVAK